MTRPHIVLSADPPRPCGANPADVDLVRVGKVEAAVEAGHDLKCQRPTNPPSAIVTSLAATTPVVFTTLFTVEMNQLGGCLSVAILLDAVVVTRCVSTENACRLDRAVRPATGG